MKPKEVEKALKELYFVLAITDTNFTYRYYSLKYFDMNWTKIKENYPEAFKKCSDRASKDLWESPENMNQRELYDFFDEQGIYLIISPFYSDKGRHMGFAWATGDEINDDNLDTTGIDRVVNSRIEAEEAAFTKAMEILNDKLSKK